MGYIGAKNIKQISKNAKFIKITKAGFYESMVHSVEMTAKKYKLQTMIIRFFISIIIMMFFLK